jgi:hypothetical protein
MKVTHFDILKRMAEKDRDIQLSPGTTGMIAATSHSTPSSRGPAPGWWSKPLRNSSKMGQSICGG